MIGSTLPAAGLTLIHDTPSSKSTGKPEAQQFIQLDLLETITKDILKSLKNNDQVRLKLGKKPIINYGKRSVSLQHGPSALPSDIFSGPTDGCSPMYFSGRLNHALEVQKANEATAGADEALATLENTLKSMQEHRASTEASLVTGKKDIKPISIGARGHLYGSSPSSPFLSAAISPALAPTSTPALSSAPSKDKIRLDAMRIPIVHLLAIRPTTTDKIAQLLHAPKDECEKVLDKVAREVNGRRELKEKFYRELDVWKFPYSTKEDRQTAIEHAIHAYDKTRLERNDALWQLLLPKDERGKGKVLSKLNFDNLAKPAVPARPTVAADKDNKDSKESKDTASEREEKPKKPKVVKEPAAKKKPADDGEPKVLKSTAKLLAKLAKKETKKESKYKSSERIENSDEEAEVASKSTVKATLPVSKVHDKETDKSQPRPSLNKTQLHKPRLSESSASSVEHEKLRRPVEKEKPKQKAQPRNEKATSRVSPRPRNNSSPQKPSPLGSSPPTNSTDIEESSKGSAQSSAPSSPPSSNDIPLAQRRQNFPPVTTSKTRDIVKRRAERSDEEPPAKKHHAGGDRINSLPKSLTSQLQHPTPERRSSGSSASSPEKPKLSKQTVIDAAKSFTSYYGKYRDLHEKLSRLTSAQREERDVNTLWKMHKRLDEMKANIWHNWAKVGGGD